MFTFISLAFLLLAAALAVAIVMAMRSAADRAWRFEMSRVIGDALGVIARAPVPFFLIALVGNVAPLLLFGFGARGFTAIGLASADIFASWLWVVGPLMLVVAHFGHMLLVTATLESLAGRAIALDRLLKLVLRVLPAGIAVAILFWAAVIFGLLFFAIPALVFACLWFVVTPSLIAERGGVLASFGRSVALTSGIRWYLVLLLVIGGIFWLVVQMMVASVAAMFDSALFAGVAYAILTAATGVISPAIIASTYHALRTHKEGLRGDDLERVFA